MFTPVISTTRMSAGSRKRLTIEDILLLKERFDNADVPLEDRFLILNPKHVSDLILFDVKAFKSLTDISDGHPNRFAGFNVLQTSVTPTYNSQTGEKTGYGAEAAETDTFCSFAFHKQEVMKADGEVYLYSKEDDPEERGTIVGFDKRFIALPIRDRAIGAIISSPV